MFKNLFAPKPKTPQELALKLLSIWHDNDVNQCFQVLNLSEPQKNRYLFSTLILTATLPLSMAASSGKKNLLPFLATAYGLTLSVWEDKDSFVRLGDWVITEDEHIRLPEILEQMFQQRVSVKGIENHKIQLGTLLTAVAFIRYEQQIKDVNEIVKSDSPADDPESLYKKYGARLQSYICGDMFCSEWIQEERVTRATTFNSLARVYCKRIAKVYLTAISDLLEPIKSVE